jgi:4'-phosphopantetheinyl transferase EntD
VIEEILPAGVASAEAFGDPTGAMLLPAEEAALGRSVDRRHREFTTARLCARRALAQLGQPPVAIPRGRHGEPLWPTGLVGSITHCAGYRAAAVAHASQMVALGIDAEPNDVLPPDGVLEVISTSKERARLCALASTDSRVCWDRLLFSGKEAVYKAWFPLTQRSLGFEDADMLIDPAGGFSVRLLVPGRTVAGRPLRDLVGRWLVRDGMMLTAIVLPAPRLGSADRGMRPRAPSRG